jgi:imidazolonepropionase-like amidohydrolase
MHCCTRATLLNAALVLGVSSGAIAQAPSTPPKEAVLFANVRVFDGKANRLSTPKNVLVIDNVIATIASTPISDPADATVRRIEGNGRTLMPGLIDNHWHTMFVRPTPAAMLEDDIGYTNLQAAAEAGATLMRGFTTVRDLGGPSFGLKRAIDEGLTIGPRIYPSGAMITITGGHGDFRSRAELPRQLGGPLSRAEQKGGSMIVDSPDEVRVRVREQLLLGASQIKLTAGGGVASPHSPLDVSTFTAEELKAAVEAAENWGTYVTVHAYTPTAIQRAIAAGVKVIEHGHLMDEASAKLMAERGIWLSFQPFTNDGHVPPMAPANLRRLEEVWSGTEHAMDLARKHKLKIAFGTDILFSPEAATRQTAELTKMTRWFSAAEALIMATGTNGELLKLSGPRDPYPGKIGVIEAGALADLLLVNGDPLTHIELLENTEQIIVIMKDGKIFKHLD